MAPTLDEAVKRLENALGLLEASVARRLDVEKRGAATSKPSCRSCRTIGRAFAVELDGALSRLHRFEAAADDVGERVRRAIGAIEDVLAGTEESGTE